MEPIRLSGEQFKTLQEAIPFQRPVHTTPDEPPILPASDLAPAPTEAGEVGVAGVTDAEPYRKKFRKKPSGDVISGPSQAHDSDVLAQSLNDLRAADGDSPL